MESPVSCDTFVVMGDMSSSGEVVFGKNSDRPNGEVQEVVVVGPQEYKEGEKLSCTYIDLDQVVGRTLGVILSKPAWMWGAEMGANQAGVVMGNEAVWDRLSDPSLDLEPRLLGMDLLRLGLERAKSARSALDVITGLLEKYGQGGQCSDIVPDFSYHNSFLIVDSSEAWVLETADRLWVAEKVVSGTRNISNCMSITTNIDLESKGLREMAKKKGWCDGEEKFNWASVIGASTGDLSSPQSRFQCGSRLLQEKSVGSSFSVPHMMEVLRDRPSGINRPGGDFPTAGSQISILSNSTVPSCHWFTATSSPDRSVFKPFIFQSLFDTFTNLTASPQGKNLKPKERAHPLWAAQNSVKDTSELQQKRQALELELVNLASEERKSNRQGDLFSDAVQRE